MDDQSSLQSALNGALHGLRTAYEKSRRPIQLEEWGYVSRVGDSVAFVKGLPNLQSGELVQFSEDGYGLALSLNEDVAGIVLFNETDAVSVGMDVKRTRKVIEMRVGEELLGRVIDPLSRPLDEGRPLRTRLKRPIEARAPSLIDRSPVTRPLHTGNLAIDGMIPIGRGQRELILGDRQTGKSSIAVDAILNQKGQNVVCIYCSIGKESSELKRVINDLQTNGAMAYTTIIAASGKETPGLNFVAPYCAMAVAEHFMHQGKDALVIFDDLTRHAWSYRELSLLLRRPPTREAYPGDIFFIHSRLLERATQLKSGGSITALPIIETEEQNISAYIPTNLISITDGQIYLSPQLYQQGFLPAIDIGKSVSRVGGKTQLSLYRKLAKDMRLLFTQYEELESFSRFGTRLDEETKAKLVRGNRMREILKNPKLAPLPIAHQIAFLIALQRGLFDSAPTEEIPRKKAELINALHDTLPGLCEKVNLGEELSEEELSSLQNLIVSVFKS